MNAPCRWDMLRTTCTRGYITLFRFQIISEACIITMICMQTFWWIQFILIFSNIVIFFKSILFSAKSIIQLLRRADGYPEFWYFVMSRLPIHHLSLRQQLLHLDFSLPETWQLGLPSSTTCSDPTPTSASGPTARIATSLCRTCGGRARPATEGRLKARRTKLLEPLLKLR